MLTDQSLKEILAEWSFWEQPPEVGIARELTLPARLHNDLALIIQGVRRGGKSTLLTQLPKHYKLPLKQCYFCNFEDPRLLNELDHALLTRIIKLARVEISVDKPCYFFFDEIQNVMGWEKWVHAQLDRPNKNFYVLTGSNSSLLSGEFATALTGRHITLELFPFSFAEFKKIHRHGKIENYLQLGGFPRSLTFEKPYQLLQEYFNDIILRDVLKRAHARSSDSIKQVVKMAFESCGSELSFRKIAAITGLTVDTVKSYLEACEQAYLLFACPFFAFSEKKQMAKQKKYYPIDPGLRHSIVSTGSSDFGQSLELLVYLRLKQTHDKVYYWQELHKGEVDFVAVKGLSITPYQITWGAPKARHEKALQYFYEAFPQASEAIFITQDNAHEYL